MVLPAPHRGRFAPSPTGDLHFGSLVAAVGSYLAARSVRGQWLVRIEDLDRTREVPGAADKILRTLEAFGFEWDGPIMRQSERTEAYQQALDELTAADLTFACSCTRAEIEQKLSTSAIQGATDELVYLGACRRGVRDPSRSRAIRFKVSSRTVTVMDQIQGQIALDVYRDIGDFVIRRRDGFFAYQLAVVVDDAAQAITEIVRGADLLTSTHRQRLLQEALGLRAPRYAHLPVVTDAMGQKLSKSERALAIEPGEASDYLWLAMNFLQQNPPPELRSAPLTTLWQWGFDHWSVLPLKGLKSGNAPQPGMLYARTHAQA